MRNVPLLISALFVLAMTAMSYLGWVNIPPGTDIASHWDANGDVNGTTKRDHILFGMPVAAILLTVLFAAIPKVDPRTENIRRSQGLLYVGWFGSLATLLVAHGAIIAAAVYGVVNPLGARAVLYGVCVLFVIVGNFTAKSRSNFFLGVRTPWTLSSEHAWSVANRIGGWMFVLTGLSAGAANALAGPDLGAKTLFAGIAATLLISVPASYFAWRNDPERQER